MAQLILSFVNLSNREIIAEVSRLAGAERQATAQLVAALAELDARQLYLKEGCSSLFTYCTSVLHLSEHAAYSRIEAARAGRRFPLIFDLLHKGDITVTSVGLLARFLSPDNHRDVLAQAAHRSKREVEALAARLRPLPDAPSIVRRMSVSTISPAGELELAPAPVQDGRSQPEQPMTATLSSRVAPC